MRKGKCYGPDDCREEKGPDTLRKVSSWTRVLDPSADGRSKRDVSADTTAGQDCCARRLPADIASQGPPCLHLIAPPRTRPAHDRDRAAAAKSDETTSREEHHGPDEQTVERNSGVQLRAEGSRQASILRRSANEPGRARYSGGHNRGAKPAVTTPHRAVPSTYGRRQRTSCRRKVRWGRRAETSATDLTNKPSERTQVCTCEQRASHRRESCIEARTSRDKRVIPADTTAGHSPP
jgi:hypothetical protein